MAATSLAPTPTNTNTTSTALPRITDTETPTLTTTVTPTVGSPFPSATSTTTSTTTTSTTTTKTTSSLGASETITPTSSATGSSTASTTSTTTTPRSVSASATATLPFDALNVTQPQTNTTSAAVATTETPRRQSEAVEVTSSVAIASVQVTALAVSPTAVGSMQRLTAVLSVSACPDPVAGPPSVFEHPMQFTVGSAQVGLPNASDAWPEEAALRWVPSYRGAAVGNLFVLCPVLALLQGAAFAVYCVRQQAKERAAAKRLEAAQESVVGGSGGGPSPGGLLFYAKAPGSVIIVLSITGTMSLQAAVTSLSLSRGSAVDVALAVLVSAVLLATAAYIVYVTTGSRLPATLTSAPCASEGCVPVALKRGLTGEMAWVPRTTAADVVRHRQHKLIYQELREGRAWYVAVDLVLGAVSAAAGSIRSATSGSACLAAQIVVVAACVLSCVLQLALRPQIGWIPFGHATLMAAMTVIVAALNVPTATQSVAELLATCLVVLQVVGMAIPIAVAILETLALHKLRSTLLDVATGAGQSLSLAMSGSRVGSGTNAVRLLSVEAVSRSQPTAHDDITLGELLGGGHEEEGVNLLPLSSFELEEGGIGSRRKTVSKSRADGKTTYQEMEKRRHELAMVLGTAAATDAAAHADTTNTTAPWQSQLSTSMLRRRHVDIDL